MSEQTSPSDTRSRPRRRWGLITLGILALCVALVVGLWDWNWFRPLVESQASAALGRKVTIGHFGVRLGWVTRVTADDVTVANPADFPDQKQSFANVGRLTVDVNVLDYIRARRLVLPLIGLDRPVVNAEQTADGKANWMLASSGGESGKSSGPSPEIGDLAINDGHVHFVDPKLKSDFQVDVATRETDRKAAPEARATPAERARAEGSELVMAARGTYTGQPITGHFVGGALLSLRDKSQPYPIDLQVANGDTKVGIVGTIEQPLTFGGADVKLTFTGSDMSKLYPLTGIPIPATPAYSVSSDISYADRKVRLDHFAGRVGTSDIEGTIAVDPTGAAPNATELKGGAAAGSNGARRPELTADLVSRNVNLNDLGGFIGTTPGQANETGATSANKAAVAKAAASPKMLPQVPINIPKVRAADIHLRYDGRKIEGRYAPFDSLKVVLDIVDGRIQLHPVDFTVGKGTIGGTVDLAPAGDPAGDNLRANADIDFKQVDVSRLMAATHAFQGQGVIGGEARLAGTGRSLAGLLGHGDGELKLFMNGGDLSALLVDISGLEFGNALLSALGVPQRTKIDCLVTDFVLQQGVMQTKALLVGTAESNITGGGSINLDRETLDMQIRTVATYFTVGSLNGPINIGGTLKSPSILPGAEIVARGGLAAGLGVLFPPLALLPTIQLGLGQDNACAKTLQTVSASAPPQIPAPARPAPRRK